MTYEIVFSPAALDDLDRVWEASQNPGITDQYIDDLLTAVDKKKKYPKTGTPLIYLGIISGMYMVHFKAYIVFYRILGERIEVGRVLYAGSDYMKTLFGKSEMTMNESDED